MLIKRVVIQGFKTFARRTEFLFDPGVTAIVGPNGSGKSNVVDAVRWCLGEQSFSLLRSKKTSDVIFSGSDKRARLGMAEVSLTLDNSKGEIPIDFVEVEVTRRAYRDGDNEYLINGQRVRLQDVTELLAQTGLGKRTYAVIGQGLIDQVLSYSPEERRTLFEEAAGITGYQMKRAASLRRLEATEQNLTRAQDILAELSPRLKYLRRQAERAREFQEIAAELRTLLRDWYGYRWHTTLRTLEQHHALEEELRSQVTNRQNTLAGLSRRIEALRTEQAQLRSQLGDLHKESSTLHQQAEATDRELAVNGERLRQLQARAEETQRELAALRLELETLHQQGAALQNAVAAAQSDYDSRSAAVATMQQAVTARQQEQTQLEQTVEATRRTLTDVQRRRIECASRLSQLIERRATLEREQREQSQANAAAATATAVLANQLAAAEAALALDEQEAHEFQTRIAALEQEAAELRTQLRAAEAARQQADRTLDRLQTRFDLLQRLRTEGAGYASGVRAVLQAARQPATGQPLSGVLGTVAALVRVPAQLDKAIETALGGAFQDVVMESWEETRQAIDFLKRGGHGRATFLPLDRLHSGPAIPAPHLAGILGNAAQLVEYDARAEAAIHQLLGRVWVAEDLPSARTALDRYRGNARPTVVTLSGEIIRPGGAVTGGSDRNRRDDSVLARERELRDLPVEIERAHTAAQRAGTRCSELARQVEATLIQSEAEKQGLADLARRERTHRQQLEELRRQADRAQQKERWQADRLAQVEAELASLAQQETSLATQHGELEQEETAAGANLAAATAAVRAAGADELLQQLADLRAAAAEAQGHLRSQQGLLDNQQRTGQSVTGQIAAKEQRIVALDQEIAALSGRNAALAAHDRRLRSELEQLRQQIEPLEARTAHLAAQQNEEERSEREAQQALRRDESNFNAAQLQHQRTQDQLQQLRHEIEQDLGLVTLESSDDLAYQPPLPLERYVEQLPIVASIPDTLEEEVRDTRTRLARASNVNPDAPREYEEAAERYEFLLAQSGDLEAAAADLRKVIRELDLLMEVAFERTFTAVSEYFVSFFQQLFNGGTAELVLTTPDELATTGIEIIARPPGKRPQSLALLSGGERALAACALIFAILRVSPTPFCVLDEVDAALDEANVDRFRQTVDALSQGTQFIIVTHNRRTLEGANTIYGITMGNDGVSKVISLRLDGDRIVQHTNGSSPGQEESQLKAIEEIVQM
ncbi:MAG: chromosome segregation protein SMC [Chloroflexi bacterium]|nr:MAG: chromosome segregation protein SMC [Chloroflexota bacterium]